MFTNFLLAKYYAQWCKQVKVTANDKWDIILRHSVDTSNDTCSNKPINIHAVNFTRLISKSCSAHE